MADIKLVNEGGVIVAKDVSTGETVPIEFDETVHQSVSAGSIQDKSSGNSYDVDSLAGSGGLPGTNTKEPGDSWQTVVDAAGSGGTVLVMPGDHAAPGSTVTLPSANGEGITIKGFGKGCKVQVPSGGTLFQGTTSANYNTDNNVSGHVIEGLFFYQDSWSNRGKIAIHFDGALQCRVDGCWFKRLVYGIKDEATNGFSWANKYTDNDFEVVQRPIWLDGVHDPSVKDNHMEGISGAASITGFNDAVGDAVGIALVSDSRAGMNTTITGNNIEAMRDDSGNGKGLFFKNVSNNHHIANNYVEGADQGYVIEMTTDADANEVRFHFSNNDGDFDLQNAASWSAGATTVEWNISQHTGSLFRGLSGTVDELHLMCDGASSFERFTTVSPSMNTGGTLEWNARGRNKANPCKIFLQGGTWDSAKFAGKWYDHIVIEDGTTITDLSVDGATLVSDAIILRDSGTSVTRVTADGVTCAGAHPVVDLRTNATASNISVIGCQTENSALTSINGTNTNIVEPAGSNITGAT